MALKTPSLLHSVPTELTKLVSLGSGSPLGALAAPFPQAQEICAVGGRLEPLTTSTTRARHLHEWNAATTGSTAPGGGGGGSRALPCPPAVPLSPRWWAGAGEVVAALAANAAKTSGRRSAIREGARVYRLRTFAPSPLLVTAVKVTKSRGKAPVWWLAIV